MDAIGFSKSVAELEAERVFNYIADENITSKPSAILTKFQNSDISWLRSTRIIFSRKQHNSSQIEKYLYMYRSYFNVSATYW